MSIDFEEIKRRIPLKAYAEEHLEKLSGSRYICPCCNSGNGPKGTPAFSITGEKWHCFSCNQGGDSIDLVGIVTGAKTNQEKIRAAMREANMTNNTAPKTSKTREVNHQAKCQAKPTNEQKREAREAILTAQEHLTDPQAVEYLESRGISLETAEKYGLGYRPANGTITGNRIVFPFMGSSSYYHVDRDITGTSQAKYTKPKAEDVGSQPLYNPEALTAPCMVVCEGVIDAIALQEGGVKAEVMAICSNQSRYLTQALKTAQYSGTVYLCLDNDKAGLDGATELSIAFREQNIKTKSIDMSTIGANDPGELLKQPEKLKELAQLINRQIDLDEAAKREELTQRREKLLESGHTYNPVVYAEGLFLGSYNLEPISTGLKTLDNALGGGLMQGLYIIGAASSLGKTTLSIQIADSIAAQGRPVLFASIEQGGYDIVGKSLARIMEQQTPGIGITALDLRDTRKRQQWTDREYTALEKACQTYNDTIAPYLRINEPTKRPTVEQLIDHAQIMAQEYGQSPVLFIDYLQLLDTEDKTATDKRKVDDNLTLLAQYVRDTHGIVWAISSMNRASYSEVITPDAFKETGGIEYSADVLIGMQPSGLRDKLTEAKANEQKREASNLIAKNRAARERDNEVVIMKNRGRASSDPENPPILTFNAAASLFRDPEYIQPETQSTHKRPRL